MLIKSKKIFSALLSITIIALLCIPMCGCGRKQRSEVNNIRDSYGRDVDCPKEVKTIATVGDAARLVVYAGATDKLCAITEMDRPTELRPYTLVNPELFSTLPTTNNGNHLNEIDVDKEKLIELDPDVIISSRSAEECDELQEATNIPVVGAYTQDEVIQISVWDAVQIVSRVAGTEESADITIGKITKIYRELAARCTSSTTPIYRGAFNYKGSKDITGTVSHYSVYEVLKANNVADQEGIEGAYDTNLEQLLSWNPDIIFIDCTNKDKVANNKAENPEIFAKLKAFKNNQVYFTAPFNSNGTNVEYGLCEVYLTAKLLYPKAFSDVNLDQKYSEIISILLGKDVYPELKARGITIGKANI